jgi:hypothetical protein
MTKQLKVTAIGLFALVMLSTLSQHSGAVTKTRTVTRVVTRVVYRTRTLVKMAPARVVVHVRTVPKTRTVTRVVTHVVYRTRTLVKMAPARVVVHVRTVPKTRTVTRVVTHVVYRTHTLVKMVPAPAASAPNALSVALGGGGSADADKQGSNGFTNHTLTFSLQLGTDFTMPRNDYLVLAQTVPITSSKVGKVDVILPADNRIRLDYVDSAGHQQVLGGSFVVPKGSWHTVELRETVGAGSGSLALLVDGASVSGGSKLYLGTQGLTWFAVGERFSPAGSGTAGHLYIDNVTTTSTT